MATPVEGGGGHAPPGIRFLKWFRGNRELSFRTHRALVLVLTFIAYALYHASRKPPSIVKSVLESSSSPMDSSLGISGVFGRGGSVLDQIHAPFEGKKGAGAGDVSSLAVSGVVGKGGGALGLIYNPFKGDKGAEANIASSFSTSGVAGKGGGSVLDRIYIRQERGVLRGWAPFEGEEGVARLGEVDVAFLAAYAFGMYFAGHLGDRLSLRFFLAAGMVGSGACVCLFGMASWWGIHSLFYFIAVQMAAGLLQATGWPSVVAIVGNWFGKRKRGLIMGIWNAHTSVGNIAGSLVAAAMLKYGWGWSFLVPGAAIAAGGLLLFLFLVASPSYVGLPSPYQQTMPNNNNDEESNPDLAKTSLLNKDEGASEAVSFLQAWTIPGVAPFAFCLFFAKLVAYTFLYWLPFYIHNTAIQGQYFSDTTAGNLSTVFDIGGVFGGIMAGHVSDKLKARATVAASFMFAAVPTLFLYRTIGNSTLWANITLLVLSGVFVNGPYALITTAVSADLGTHSSLKGNARALATVTAIIDGTGSIGAALGPLITGFISTRGWDNVFYLLMASALVAGLMLSRLVFFEMKERLQRFQGPPSDAQS